MSEARRPSPATAPDPDEVIRLAMAMILRGRAPAKAAKLCRHLIEGAEHLEEQAEGRATVYPIRGGGVSYGGRPEDAALLASARLLKAYAERGLERFGGAR